MTATPDQQEREGNRSAGVALERQREEAGFGLVERKQFDVANLTDAEFDASLERVTLRQKRMARILETVLKDGIHYGTEKGAFRKPILKKAGQEELRNLFRLQLVHTAPPIITQSEDFVSVVCTCAVMDGAGRILAPHVGGCNSREKRFKAKGGGWTYTDARETLNDCLAFAEKRAANRATMEVTGATAFLANEEEMDAAMAEDAVVEIPWTAEDKTAFAKAAKAKGLKQDQMMQLLKDVLGTTGAGEVRAAYQSDTPKVMAAIEAWRAPGVTHVKQASFDDEPAA
jgi:hypothetical protein